MINTILVEDDLYIQKHFVDRLAADGEFHLVGVFRDAFEAEKSCLNSLQSSTLKLRQHFTLIMASELFVRLRFIEIQE